MKRYNPAEIEPKWQKIWEEQKTYQAHDDSKKPKYYALSFFPYPSGIGLHIGHVLNFTNTDVVARFKRMTGHEVLHPMGWDSFGLPAENYAIKTGVPPQITTKQNIDNFREQAKHMGFSIDWSREFGSTDPDYYRWTQWFFLLLHKRGLAYQKESAQFWCDICKTVLANEQVVNGCCWRHEDNPVTKKVLKQWFFKITDYADHLTADLDDLDWPESIKAMQRNWIGRSKGAEVEFAIKDSPQKIKVFTTRADTLYGVTFMVLAPEHPLAAKIATSSQKADVQMYIKQSQTKTDVDRMDENRRKTGVFTGAHAINPINGQEIPIWIADYVLGGYGTGAIMAVPAHDERDHAFAKRFNLPITEVIAPEYGEQRSDEQWVDGTTVIVYDETTDKFLGLDWKQGWTGLVAGGLNDGEEYRTCAERELAEEAGITKTVEFVPLGGPVFAHYEHRVKNINRIAKTQGFLAIVKDRQGESAKHEAHETFTPHWYSFKELRKHIVDLTGNAHWLEILDRAHRFLETRKTGKNYDFAELRAGEGRLVNSGPYDGLTASEAREKIIVDIAKRGFGKERTNYKIRDWLISRQRYWGAPIPMVHCFTCAVNKNEVVPKTILSFYDNETWESLKLGIKTVESRALNPEETDRSFENIAGMVGGINKNTNERIDFGILETRKYPNLRAFYADTEFATACMNDGKLPPTFSAFEKIFKAYANGYEEKINQNGLIAWRVVSLKETVPVPEDQLPVTLPDLTDFVPSGDGRSPLARATDWVNTTCPQCGGPATRETDTMDGFACSSWYFLRFADPHNNQAAFSSELAAKWLPVDMYIGGAEHAVMHLLYARMWTKVMSDVGLINFDEPFKALRNQGLLLAADGSKFSKSKGNGVDPEDIIASGYGADALRTIILFLAPFGQSTPWSPEGLGGCYRFLQRVWTITQEFLSTETGPSNGEQELRLTRAMHKTIKKVTEDMHRLGFNTAIAAQMELVNELYKVKTELPPHRQNPAWRNALSALAQLLAPIAPHLAEELWQQLGNEISVHLSDWPAWNEAYLTEETMTIVVQVNGKVRANLLVDKDAAREDVERLAAADAHVQEFIGTKRPKRVIYVPSRLVNFVV